MKEKLAQGDVEDVDINLEDADMVRNFTEKNINKNTCRKMEKNSYAIFLFLVF